MSDRKPNGEQGHAPARYTPTREDLLSECAKAQEMALEATACYRNKAGEEITYPRPDLSTYLRAVELRAKLVGLLGDGKQMTPFEVRQELSKMGYDLVPRKPALVKKAGG